MAGMSPEGMANRQKRTRARQRARHALAMRHHRQFDNAIYEIEAEVGNSVLMETIKARAMQRVVTKHRAEFRALCKAQEELEGVEEMPRGHPTVVPCGTHSARTRHLRRGEPVCEVCQQWYYELHKTTCLICGTEFSEPGRRSFCRPECRRLSLYLRYWYARANEARTRKRHYPDKARNVAESIGLDLDELVARAEPQGRAA